MYKPVSGGGDTLAVPQLVFARLSTGGGREEEARLRVALYVLREGGATPPQVARALGLKPAVADAALSYWEGAGLLAREAAEAVPPAPEAAPRRRMTTAEVVKAGQADPTLGLLLGELQRLFGAVLGKNDTAIFVTLYAQDGYPADLILTAASRAAAYGVTRAGYVESILRDWRRQGIDDCAKADRYLKLLAEREAREAELARHMGLAGEAFTLAERKKIAQWHEEYGYGLEMIEAARLAAGEQRNEVKYLGGILKKWHAKGYKSPRDVRQGEEGQNLRVSRQAAKAPGKDALAGARDYVPMKRRGGA